jgi:hypothetical protein
MTFPPPEELRRQVAARARKVLGAIMVDGPQDQTEKILGAAAMVAGAAVLIWPESRALPKYAQPVLQVVQTLWKRRALFIGNPVTLAPVPPPAAAGE